MTIMVIRVNMATGRQPFGGASPADAVTNILGKDPVPLPSLSPQRPIPLERTVNKFVIKRADDRYQSADQLQEALGSLKSRARGAVLRRVLGRFRQ